jgi:hypothetical protein
MKIAANIQTIQANCRHLATLNEENYSEAAKFVLASGGQYFLSTRIH